MTVTPLTYVSPTQATFSATIAAGATPGDDYWYLECGQYYLTGLGSIVHITPCAIPITPTITSISPSTIGAGQSTQITINGSNFLTSAGCGTVTDVIIANRAIPMTWPNVTPNIITTTVTPSPSKTAETATVNVVYSNPNGGYQTAAATLQIAPCPIPTITSVSPNVWFAGQSYNVTVTGTNFTTPAKATATCPATTVTAVAGVSGAASTWGTVTVNSSTTITIASVTPPANETTEGAKVILSGAKTSSTVSSFNNADVLEIPTITWASDPDGSSPVIAGPNATLTDPSAVVGQQILLTTTPNATTFANPNLTLPVAVTLAAGAPPTVPNPWTLSATPANIGGYNPTTDSAAVTQTVLTNPDTSTTPMTIYWVYPGSPAVTYNYCVNVASNTPGGSTSTQCSPSSSAATATFSVTGPTGGTMTVTPYPQLRIVSLGACVRNGNTIPAGPWLMYGSATGGTCLLPTGGLPGVAFSQPTGYSNDSDGAYSVVQLINSDVTTGTNDDESFTDVLDTQYPYGDFPNYLSDSPIVNLLSTYTNVSRTMTATSFLMWQPPPPSIPVPLGYQQWGFSGSATCSTSCGSAANWTATTNAVPGLIGTTNGLPGLIGGFVTSTASQTSVGNNTPPGSNITLQYGIPTWTGATDE